MTIFFSSDLHLGHRNVIQYAKRPYQSVEEMDAALISNWNSRVTPHDTVYVLGDFTLKNDPADALAYVKQLRGQIHLVRGNHDKFLDRQREKYGNCGFASVSHYKEIKVPLPKAGNESGSAHGPQTHQKIILFHYAMKTWNGSHRGTYQLFGHSHGSLPRDFTMKQLDVGVDCWGYRPISFEEVQAEMLRHTFVPVDHHGAERESKEEDDA